MPARTIAPGEPISTQTHLTVPPAHASSSSCRPPPRGRLGLLVTQNRRHRPRRERTTPTAPSPTIVAHPHRPRATLNAAKLANSSSSSKSGLARRCTTGARTAAVLLREARRPERSHQRNRVLPHRRRTNPEDVRHELRHPKHRRTTRNSRRLDH